MIGAQGSWTSCLALCWRCPWCSQLLCGLGVRWRTRAFALFVLVFVLGRVPGGAALHEVFIVSACHWDIVAVSVAAGRIISALCDPPFAQSHTWCHFHSLHHHGLLRGKLFEGV